MADKGDDSVNHLMAGLRDGDSKAAGKLVELFYPQLRQMAATRMLRERTNHTWQPTALVNELYLELIRIRALPEAAPFQEERDAFFRLAAFLMKRLLIHHARPLPKRMAKIEIGEAAGLALSGEQSLQEIENVLSRLGAIDPTLRAVVEMKAFEGLSREEIGQRLGCSVRTVARHWEFAQQWLKQALR